jgi:DNA-directed RNA polymerase specialized sigma24 family protein
LRVPSNILHSEKSSPGVISAFDNAVKALLRELQSLKADLRRERFWKRKERRKQLRQLKATGFAAEPMAEGSGPQRFEDVIRELFQEHYAELLRHVRRRIRYDEMAGDIPKGALVKTEGLLPDLHAVPPDEIAAEKDLLEHLQTAVQNWPRAERDTFELYFIEGFDPDEIAMVTRQTLKTVQENISSIQNRLREEVLEQALI